MLKHNYDEKFLKEVYEEAEGVSQLEFSAFEDKNRKYRIEYRDNAQFVRIAKAIGIMTDFKVMLKEE